MESLKVLIVDDDPPTCSLLETILKMEDYQTASAHHIKGGDIISLLETEAPDIMVLDFHLGGEESLSYLSTIRQHPDWARLGILMMSAVDYTEDVLRAGANGFVLKPFDWQDMAAAINKISDDIA